MARAAIRRIAGSPSARLSMATIKFQHSADYIEVNQLLKLVEVCESGGAGKALVAAGLVFVGGQPETRKTA